jgi:hypothetical protein
MALIINATPGSPTANSFLTYAEALTYYEGRLELPAWEDADSPDSLLVMATRLLTSMFAPGHRKLIRQDPRSESYYFTAPTWTGVIATTTQRLPWPRIGMFDVNGNPIPETVIPEELKMATAEFAGQLGKGDRLLDNDVAVQGISSVSAGSVSVSFKSSGIDVVKIIPDAVFDLLVPSWLTDALIEPANAALFDVVSY